MKPDLVVGHSGFGSTTFLADLYDCPIINYFEYYYHGRNSDLDFRPEIPVKELDLLRSRTRNAMILLDLQTCAAGYSPTQWQKSLFPVEYQPKIDAIFDGIDTNVWHRRKVPRQIGDRVIPPGTRIVTYVSRGFESMRGFDVFMKVAKRICDARKDVVFVCVGSDRVCYGGDMQRISDAESYRDHILKQDNYDLSRFIFTGRVEPNQLADIISMGDLHIYLTVPFVLSWSLMNSLACARRCWLGYGSGQRDDPSRRERFARRFLRRGPADRTCSASARRSGGVSPSWRGGDAHDPGKLQPRQNAAADVGPLRTDAQQASRAIGGRFRLPNR